MPNTPALRILVFKQQRELHVCVDDRLESVHPVILGRNGDADKRIEGDEATPLGDFYVCAKNPHSRFYRSLCLSYPNAEHAARGLRDGLIDAAEHGAILEALMHGRMPPQKTRLGGEIYIHGCLPDTPDRGTRGCIALDNGIMGALFDRIPLGTPVRITP